jgi:hypothetical protein
MILQLLVIILIILCLMMMISLYCDLLDNGKFLYFQYKYSSDKIVHIEYMLYLFLLFSITLFSNHYLWKLINIIFKIKLNNILMTSCVIIYCVELSKILE